MYTEKYKVVILYFQSDIVSKYFFGDIFCKSKLLLFETTQITNPAQSEYFNLVY